jgi:nucleotide-binding universal stress UspA family protein
MVVGVDGSEESDLALGWAATQAATEGLALVLLTAVSSPAPESAAWLDAHGIDHRRLRAQLKEEARALLRRCDARVHATYADLEIRHDLRFVDPRDALLDADTDLLVVGTRGRGTTRRLVLGSVTSTVITHATSPTVVVRPENPSGAGCGVLVGIAGDSGDAAAIDLAFRLAAARGLSVAACHSLWDVVDVDQPRDIGPDELGYDDQRALLTRAVLESTARYPDVAVQCQLTQGLADERLILAARNAALVVVGHRRKPFLNELIYGSTASRVVEHTRCTAVVVPYREHSVSVEA